MTCRVTGFAVADKNSWWYQIASSPWNDVYYVSADAFYNNGATSGSLTNTPFVDTSIQICANNQEQPLFGSAVGSSSAEVDSSRCQTGDPVDCASGDFWQTFTDVSIPGRGPNLDLTRTYNNLQASNSGIFGNGWSSSYDQHLTLNGDGSITLTLSDGSQTIAEPNGSGGYLLPPWSDSTLQGNSDGSFTFTERSTQILQFSGSGLLLYIRDLNGYQTNLTYNSANQLTAVTDPAGRILSFSEGTNGLVSSVTDPMGRTTSYNYDSSGDLTSSVDPLGRITAFTYDGSHQMLTLTDPRGGVVTNTYDSQGRVLTQTDPAGLKTTYTYTGDNFSSLGGTTTVTDPHGSTETKQYADGFLTRITKGVGSSSPAVTTYTYDPSSFGVTSITDPNGNVTRHTYDSVGHVLSTTDPLNRTSTYTYNSLGELTSSTSPKGEITTKSYDSNGNLLTVTDPLGGVTTYSYSDPVHAGDVTSVSDPTGASTSYTYDLHGDEVSKSVTQAGGTVDTSTSAYDADGELLCAVSADANQLGVACPTSSSSHLPGTTTSAYDGDGEVVASTDANGGTTNYSYDGDGNRLSTTDPSGNITLKTYDADNRVSKTIVGQNGPVPSTTADAYDLPPGTGVCSVIPNSVYCNTTTDPNGGITVNFYDALGNLIEVSQPGGIITSYSYDSDGNKLTKTDAMGRVTSYSYDADSELTSTIYSDGVTPNVSYSFDADGHRTSMSDGTGTTTYNYDPDGRLLSLQNGASAVTGYAYNSRGDIVSLTYPNGKSVQRTFDAADRLVSETDWLGHTTSFTYDADGNVIGTSYPNGDVVNSTFDFNDALTSTGAVSGSGSLASITYVRNADGLVTQETDSGGLSGSTNYQYDSKNQLGSAGATNFGYDPAGNLTLNGSSHQSFNSADELTSSSAGSVATSYTYDAVGDLTSSTPSAGTATTFGYDQADHLTSVAAPTPLAQVTGIAPSSGSTSGGTTVTVTGAGFTGATQVLFGAVPATSFTILSDTQIAAVAPAEAAASHNVYVVTSGGTSAAVSGDVFTFKIPTITAIAPSSGSTAGGTAVTITGTGFTGATQVLFGTVPATSLTVISDTQITAIAPAESAASHNVFVVTPSGTSGAVSADLFTYKAPVRPSITSIAPASGSTSGGTAVTITGTGFTGATQVLFGTVAGTTLTVLSDTQITVVSPAEAAGSHNVYVTAPGGTSPAVAADLFTFKPSTPIAVVSGIAPSSGSTGGGTAVTITGTGFTGATQVLFGTVPATSLTVISDTQITAIAPGGGGRVGRQP